MTKERMLRKIEGIRLWKRKNRIRSEYRRGRLKGSRRSRRQIRRERRRGWRKRGQSKKSRRSRTRRWTN